MDAKDQIQAVFRRLDPLLQTLLPLVARFKDIIDSGNQDSSLIELIHSQIQILQNFTDVIDQLGPSTASALIVLADYISLPLNAILHTSVPFATATGQQDRILVSHVRRLNQSVSRAIQTYVQSSCSKDMHLKDTHIINFLVAAISVLPAPITNFDKKELDNCLELFMSLSEAIKTLIRVCPGLSLYNKWEGDLVIKLADFGTSVALIENDHLNLLSLEILDELIKKVKRSELWQRIFPGIFASIYRRLTASGLQTSAGLSTQIQAKSLQVIEGLIKASIPPRAENDSSCAGTSIPHESKLTAHIASARRTGKNTENKFLLELRKRICDPLSVLIRQCVQSPSDTVRIQLASLCETILMDSENSWPSPSLLEQTFDACLILQSEDSSDDASTRLQSVILTFQNSKQDKKSWMIPRIQSLAVETLSMANGYKHTEMRMQLQLLLGYIRCLGTDGSRALATSTNIRTSLIALGDVDLESCSPESVEKVANGQQSITRLRLRHMNKDTSAIFRNMLRHLGATIGWKHGSRLVDALLSDFYERSFEHVSCSENFEEDFLHENLGALVVCEEVIRGAFTQGQTVSRKEYNRKRESLLALASSCLPLFVDNSLWNIRTIEGNMNTSYSKASAPKAFLGNACVIALALRVTSTFFDVLGRDSGMLAHVMLCPIIEKASQRNNVVVKDIAKDAALTLAKACGLPTLSDLLQQHQSAVLVGLNGRFQSMTPNEPFLRDAMKTLQWVLLHTNASKEGTRGLADLLSFLEGKIDRLAIHNPLSVLTLQDLVALHRTYFEHLGDSFSRNDCELANASSTLKHTSKPWLAVLSVYEKSPKSMFQRNLVSEEEEEPPLQHSEMNIDDLHLISKIISRENYILSNSNLELQVSACSALSSAYRALTHSSKSSVSYNNDHKILTRQLTSSLFTYRQQTGADDSALENAVLKQAAMSWPSTKARLHNLTENVLRSRKVDISAIACEPSVASQVDLGTTSQFSLAALLEMITVVCECCGNFMTTRFTKDVWPAIARYLGFIIQRESHSIENIPKATDLHDNSIIWETEVSGINDSDRHLIVSMLDCLGRVYRVLDLSDDILSPAALALLPFLDTRHFGPVIGEKAMLAMKRLADANCDALWRPLLQLMGSEIPPFPMGLTGLAHLTTVDKRSPSDDTVLSQKAAELLTYINCLPEQAVS